MGVRITVKHPGVLTAAEIAGWRAMLQGEALSSPYFAPEFSQIAGDVHADAQVALVNDGVRLSAILPFRKGPLGFCRPIAGALTDFQGLIARPETSVDVRAVARAAGIGVMAYDALPADQGRHGFTGEADTTSAVIGLEDGFEAWRDARAAQSSAVKRLGSKRRGLERTAGPLRVVIDDRSDAAFALLRGWKREQLAAAGHFDIFAAASTGALLERIRARHKPAFRGLLSTLYAGEQPVAAHFGMQAGPVLHYWFPGYDRAFGKYSPGNLLLESLAEAGAEHGWTAIHLGAGDYSYKREFASRTIPLLRGALRTPSAAGLAHMAMDGAARAAESAPLGPLSALPGKAMRKAGRIADFGWAAA